MESNEYPPTVQSVIKLNVLGYGADEIARIVGRSRRWVFLKLREADLSKEYLSHKKWLPWRMSERQNNSNIGQNVAMLSRKIHGEENIPEFNTGYGWAVRSLAEGQEYDYDQDEGLIMVPLGEGPGLLEALVREVSDVLRKEQTRKDHQGEVK
ncbi:hypothetical protein ACN20G_30040 (plasmid) [Streptomyces sp. BI20]|uniref:hypothetical protein n=1 Tax=Streptomyces sp. BI20 TaxID=3403460 RepID=UPI003C7531B3